MASIRTSPLSSPDPLGLSLTDKSQTSPSKAPQKPTTPRKALGELHGNGQSQQFYLSTPSPGRIGSSSPTKSSARAQQAASPWRIRVTVEAEPENNMPDSPSKRMIEKTTTTTIPLKAAVSSSPSSAKRGRGRPRKSLDGPVKRNGTPKPKPTARRKIDNGRESERAEGKCFTQNSPQKSRGRPRKNLGSDQTQMRSDDTDSDYAVESLQGTQTGYDKPHAKGQEHASAKPSRKRAAPSSNCTTPTKNRVSLSSPLPPSSLSKSERSTTDALEERPTKRRSLDKTDINGDFALSRASPSLSECSSQLAQADLSVRDSTMAEADEAMWRSMIRRDGLPLSDPVAEESHESGGLSNVAEVTGNDPTDEHQEYDSILESEGFSMVSASSLPSAQQHVISQADHHRDRLLIDSAIDPLPEDPAAEHSNDPQDTSTPSLAASTSTMPPPPLPSAHPNVSRRPITKPTDGTPRLGRVVRAGIALQGVLSPISNTSQTTSNSRKSSTSASSTSSSAESSKNRVDHLFDGFGAGTRRELRAGLRLGEELAKRQQSNQEQNELRGRTEDDIFAQNGELKYPHLPETTISSGYSLRIPGAEQQVQYPALQNPQLPSPAGSSEDDDDQMSWKASSPISNDLVIPSIQRVAPDSKPNLVSDLEHQTPTEVRWQREREVVIKQIEDANTSQVMVIDSDDEADAGSNHDEDDAAGSEDGDIDDGDIWLEEANSSRSMPETISQVADALFQAELPKPRRSKLPNTWRRGSQIIYSDELEQPPDQVTVHSNEEMVKAIQKGDLVKKEMTEELTSATSLPPAGAVPSKPVPTRANRTTRVEVNDQYRAVERPGWKCVKGRLQTPRGKTLKNVLSRKYDEEPLSDPGSEDDEVVERDQEKLDGPDRNNHLTPKDPFKKKDKEVAVEASLESLADVVPPTPRFSLARTPPGSPPQHLLFLYHPPPTLAPITFLGSLTTYIPTLRAPASIPVPNAETLDPAVWNIAPYPPIYTHLPWEEAHWRTLRPYFEIQTTHPGTYPFNPYSPAAKLLSTPIYARNNFGWVRYTSKSDCGLVDKYMEVLRIKGTDRRPGLWNTGDEARIDELTVAIKIFDLWQYGVMNGTVPVGEGNSTGNVPKTKVPFTPSKLRKPPKWKKEVPILP